MTSKDDLIKLIAEKKGVDASFIESLFTVPKDVSHGDTCLPHFQIRGDKNPAESAKEFTDLCNKDSVISKLATSSAVGPYQNFIIHDSAAMAEFLTSVAKNEILVSSSHDGVMLIESPGPNTNKPLHLGHLRNILLGSSLFNLSNAIGKDVKLISNLHHAAYLGRELEKAEVCLIVENAVYVQDKELDFL